MKKIVKTLIKGLLRPIFVVYRLLSLAVTSKVEVSKEEAIEFLQKYNASSEYIELVKNMKHRMFHGKFKHYGQCDQILKIITLSTKNESEVELAGVLIHELTHVMQDANHKKTGICVKNSSDMRAIERYSKKISSAWGSSPYFCKYQEIEARYHQAKFLRKNNSIDIDFVLFNENIVSEIETSGLWNKKY